MTLKLRNRPLAYCFSVPSLGTQRGRSLIVVIRIRVLGLSSNFRANFEVLSILVFCSNIYYKQSNLSLRVHPKHHILLLTSFVLRATTGMINLMLRIAYRILQADWFPWATRLVIGMLLLWLAIYQYCELQGQVVKWWQHALSTITMLGIVMLVALYVGNWA
jgi:hypothetical protein